MKKSQSLISKILHKLGVQSKSVYEKILYDFGKPDMVCISQGSPTASLNEMEWCCQYKLPFKVVTQLMAEVHWLGVNDTLIAQLRNKYQHAEK